MGKTNLLDALHYLSFTKSHLSITDSLAVQYGQEAAVLDAVYRSDFGDERQLLLQIRPGHRKVLKRNKKEYPKLSDHIGAFPLVIVSPQDYQLILGGSEERQLQSLEVIEDNAHRLEAQLRNIFRGDDNIEFVNNRDWLGKLSMIEFLRDYGKLVNINYLLAKDSISSRLDNGLSFTEFSYTILQGIDYAYLNEHHNVKLQIGGSDQWGNITTGLEIMRKLRGDVEAYGFTIPLMLKSDGTKFGKSTGGAVWLDPEQTTPYEFYQFWFNTADTEVVPALKKFTFLEKDKIEALRESSEKEPHLRLAQKALAEEMVKIVHGEKALESALNITKALFSGNIKELTHDELKAAVKGMPKSELEKKEYNIVDFLVESKLVQSKRQAREDVNNGAVYVNGDKVTDLEYVVEAKDRLEDGFTVLRRGKKKYLLVEYK